MIGTEWVRRLTKDGWIKKLGKDRYRIVDAVHGYIAFSKDDERRQSRSASASRVQEARAREIELRTAKEEGRLVEVSAINFAIADILGTYRSELEGVAAGSTRDLTMRAEIQKRIDEAMDRCRERFEKVQSQMDTGQDVDLDGGEE